MKANYYSTQDDISYVPLTPEHEKELFARFYNNDDLEARNELIRCHLKLAAKLALQRSSGVLPDDDAISAGNFGLMQALESRKFDPNYGVRFSTYVRNYIKGQTCTALRFLCIVPSRDSEIRHYPEGAAVTGNLAVLDSFTSARGTIGINSDTRSMREPSCCDHGYDEKELHDRQLREVAAAMATLPELERRAIEGEFFLQQNFADTARACGATREGVRKAHARAMIKLTRALSALPKEEML